MTNYNSGWESVFSALRRDKGGIKEAAREAKGRDLGEIGNRKGGAKEGQGSALGSR